MLSEKQIYLDNAASSYPKPISVYRNVFEFMKTNGANPGRSGHKMSEKASFAVFETREKAAGYFKVSADNIIFTKNATEALNLVIFSALKNGKKHFLTSDMDHNSVLRPLAYLEQKYKIRVSFFQYNNFSSTTENEFPDVVICTAASNVTGNILPLKEISDFCKKNDILFIIDASQTAGYPFIYDCDIVCTAGHKGLYGPQGSGILIIKSEKGKEIIQPMLYGGTGTDSLYLAPDITFPESFESGTLNTPAIVGLGAGFDFILKNEEEIYKREKYLQKTAYGELAKIEGVVIYTDINNSVPIIAFNLESVSSEKVTSLLSEQNICVRGGYHCAPLCHKSLGTVPGGTVRVSIGAFNRISDIHKLISSVKNIEMKYKL